LDDPSEGKHAAMWRKGGRKAKNKIQHSELYKSLETELRMETGTLSESTHQGEETNSQQQRQVVLRNPSVAATTTGYAGLGNMYPTNKFGAAIQLPNQATEEELQESTQPPEDKLNMTAWKEEMPASEIEDVEYLFRSEEEVAQKEAIFNKLNKEYIQQQEQKESDRLREEAAAKDKQEDEMAQAEGHARYMGRKKRRSARTEEALMEAVENRKVSRKINYDAMSAIFDEEGGFSTSAIDQTEDPVFAMI